MITPAELFASSDAFATSLLLTFVDQFEASALRWTPENIDIEIQASLGVDVSSENLGKLLAAIQILTSDDFYHSVADFSDLCASLSGIQVSDRQLVMPDGAELVWGMIEGGLISSTLAHEEPTPFTEEIKQYVAKTLRDEGIAKPPAFTGVERSISDDFSDDPEMFSAIWTVQEGLASELGTWTNKNLDTLVDQLSRIKLTNGSTRALCQTLARRSMPQDGKV